MKIRELRFEPGGGHSGHRDTHWATIEISLSGHSAGNGNPQVRIDIPIDFSPDMTMQSLREKVQELAVEAMEVSVAALANNTWTGNPPIFNRVRS